MFCIAPHECCYSLRFLSAANNENTVLWDVTSCGVIASQLIPWCSPLKAIISSAKEFCHSVYGEGSLSHLQQPTNCSYPGPENSNVRWSITFKVHFNNIILPSTPRSSKWLHFFSVSNLKLCMRISSPPYVPHAQPISSSLTWSV